MWRNIASNALTLLVVILIGLGGLLAWGQNQFTRVGPLEQGICLRVDRGASIAAVSRQLADQGAITQPVIFRLGAEYADKADQLKFGSYLVAPGSSMQEILAVITRGGANTCGAEVNFRIGVNSHELILREVDPATGRYNEVASFVPGTDEPAGAYDRAVAQGGLRYRVTLAEGVTSWQVVEALSTADFLSGQVSEVPPEGSLAPDSYEVERDEARADLLAEMAARQARILNELWAARAEGLPYDSPEQALIMASIVEKETGVADERPTVASVFVNRLRQGMRLQTDPTVIYGITNGRSVLGRGLRQSELRRATPYNTYVIDGMPPTPIANPGRESIAAALNPAETDYLYFVADGGGGHAFAETLAEHNRNVARWRQIEAERARESAEPQDQLGPTPQAD
jgi:UPF0755 protein